MSQKLALTDIYSFSLVGRVDVSLAALFQSPNVLQRRELPLAQVNRQPRPQGKLSFSIGFFALAARGAEKITKASTTSESLPPFLRNHPRHISRAGLYSERIKNALESLTPPDPDLPSGILSIQIHQLEKLEIPSVRGTIGSSSHKGDHVPPSTYCQLVGLIIFIVYCELKTVLGAVYQRRKGVANTNQEILGKSIRQRMYVYFPHVENLYKN